MKGLINGLPAVVMRVRYKNGIKQEYSEWTRQYYTDDCIGAFVEREDAVNWIAEYVRKNMSASESFGWRCYVERNKWGEISAYSAEKNGTAVLTRFYIRSANVEC